MIRKFASSAALFAVSVLLFSFCRQILFFPALARLDDPIFVTLSFLVFAFEALAYGLTGAMPDYYVRKTRGKTSDPALMQGLGKLLLLAFPVTFLLLLNGISAEVVAVLALYLWLFASNALRMKILFNDLKFSENFVYIAFRLVPYAAIFASLTFLPATRDPRIASLLFASLLCIFEAFYWLRLRAIVRRSLEGVSSGPPIELRKLAWIIAPFVTAYILSGVAQRGDLLLIKHLAEPSYSDYAKLYIVVNFFCSPLVIMSANPLLSIINNQGFDLYSPTLLRVIAVIVGIAAIFAVAAMWLSQFIYLFFYDLSLPFGGPFICALVFLTIFYSVLRTLAVSYASPLAIAGVSATSISAMALGLVVLPSVAIAILCFYIFRVLAYVAALALSDRAQSG